MWYSGNLDPESVTFQLTSVYSDQHGRKTTGKKERSEQATWFAGANAKCKRGAPYSKNYLKFQDMLQQSILGVGPTVTAQVNTSMKLTPISFFYFIIHYFIISLFSRLWLFKGKGEERLFVIENAQSLSVGWIKEWINEWVKEYT